MANSQAPSTFALFATVSTKVDIRSSTRTPEPDVGLTVGDPRHELRWSCDFLNASRGDSMVHVAGRDVRGERTASVGEKVGFGKVVDLWHSLGMKSRIEPYPSLELGSFEVTPLELATAYAVLAGGGKRVEPRFFTSIEDASGEKVVENRSRSRNVVSSESAYLVTDMLRTAVDSGTGSATA